VIQESQCANLAPPRAEAFPDSPLGWYILGQSHEITSRPKAVELFGERLVCFRLSSGRPVTMDARCWHLGADLSKGVVAGDQIVCPFHGWRYGASGACEFIPNQEGIPAAARQRTYQTEEHAGYVFVFPCDVCDYPPPFFASIDRSELIAAPSFEFFLECPWWLVGTNGFDLQHFTGLHHRRLVGLPAIESPHPTARRIVTTFEICGSNWQDRLTRRFAGSRVTMDVTIWSGTLAFVMAQFHDSSTADPRFMRTTSYGMTEIRALSSPREQRSHVRVTIFRKRRPGLAMLDWLDVRIKRYFIHAFLKPDTLLLTRAQYKRDHLIHADRQMIDYLCWLAAVSSKRSNAKEPT